MSAATIGKVAAAVIVTASAALGAFKAGRAASSEPAFTQVPPPTISAPALTTADIEGVLRQGEQTRQELAAFRKESAEGFRSLGERVSKLEGYQAGQLEARRGTGR